MNSVPTNQPISRTTYGIAVREAARLPESFVREHAWRIDRGFEHGEPVAMMVEELTMVYSVRPTWQPTKTPRALAVRSVRVS